MDNLSLRRALYQDPASVNPELLKNEPQLLQLQQELLLLDQQLKQQLQIEVPPQLAEQVLLRQRMLSLRRFSRRQPLFYASAAALLLAVLSWRLTEVPVAETLAQHALRHVYHELPALSGDTVIPVETFAPLFAELGLRADLPVPVRYARFCNFSGVRSLHLVLEIGGQALTVFLLPTDPALDGGKTAQFADARFFGHTQLTQHYQLVLLAEEPRLLAQAGDLLEKSLYFNI